MKSYTSPQLLSLPSRSDLACPSLRTPTCPSPRLSMPPAAALTRALQQAPGHFPLVRSLSLMTAHLKMGGPSEMTGGWRSVPVTAAFCLRSRACLSLLTKLRLSSPLQVFSFSSLSHLSYNSSERRAQSSWASLPISAYFPVSH